jgi:hypothetical protein
MGTIRVAIIFSVLAGCASVPVHVIHESAKGVVYLEKASDPTFEATHPVSLHPSVLRSVLQGVQVEDERTALDTLLSSEKKMSRVFTDEAVDFLAPLLSSALEKAAADQVIQFRIRYAGRIVPPEGGAAVGSSEPSSIPRSETTAGMLYAYGRSLDLTITELQHRAERPDAVNMPNRRLPNPNGLGGKRVAFDPSAALRPGTFAPLNLGDPDLTTLVIDYQRLEGLGTTGAKMQTQNAGSISRQEAPSNARQERAAGVEDMQAIKELLIKKDLEVEALKTEVGTLKRRLAEQQFQIEQLRHKDSPSR